jgi:hypothetical protein
MPSTIPMMDAPLERLVRHVVEAMHPLEVWLFGIEHRLEERFKRFPAHDEGPTRLLPFVGYSAYATVFRYPTPGGRIPADPPADALRRDTSSLRDLITMAREQLLGSASER